MAFEHILNGSATHGGAFEFLPSLAVVIPTNNSLYSGACSSTVISKRHISTAVHCIFYEKPSVIRGVVRVQFSYAEAFLFDYRPTNDIVKVANNRVQIPLKDYSYQPKFYVHLAYVGVLSAGLVNNALYTPLSSKCDWISKITNKEVNYQTLHVGPNPSPPGPDNKSTQKVPLNNKTITTFLPGTSKPEAQHSNGNSGAAFAFNILLCLFIGIFFFA
uniref:Peptidase S1 domain-containing protein n=1 Tax=Panagrolaimus davidi TaxID=227884 RepID=A0A914Q508_9BILA